MCLNSLPLQAQLGLFFLFCLSSVSLDSPLSERRLYSFLSSGVFRLPWIRPQLPHTAPTGPVTRLAGVVPLPGPQNRTQGCTGPSFGFLSRTSSPLPLKGEGLGIIFLGFVWFTLLVHRRLTLAQQGLSLVSLVSFPYLAFKTAHRATRGLVLFHRFFLVRFGSDQAAKFRSSLQFTASRMGRIV